jgi:site-specific DNA-methyltransferase (adenine-specific)
LLIPARTDTRYFHDYILYRSEIRFIKNRLDFNEQGGRAPFPSMLVIFRSGGGRKETDEISLL